MITDYALAFGSLLLLGGRLGDLSGRFRGRVRGRRRGRQLRSPRRGACGTGPLRRAAGTRDPLTAQRDLHPAVREAEGLRFPGTLTVSAALFAIVYGFAHVESTSWTDRVSLGSLVGGVVLLAVFVWLESRVAHPLLPLRLVRDRTRGGAFLAVFVLGMGMFSIFLFLTYYLEAGIGYSPIEAGLAFLPMVVGIVASSTTAPSLLLPRVGPKAVITAGFLVSASGMALLARLALDSTYVAHIMPGMILLGLGIGAVMTTAFQGATAGVHHEDTGVASALINTSQQVGGSISTALLTTIASSATADYLSSHKPGALTVAQAGVEGYTATLAWGAGIFVIGAVLSAFLIPNRALAPSEGEPVIAH
ncbi:MFS transporter [Streptomyces sp. YH02]|uniref:MFS transporter n=1 Tax=Streptomyces sp. YH02 TaxID=3256999 RepID=UPI0037574FD5